VFTFLSLFVACSLAISPEPVDVLLLAFFRSTTDEDYQPLAVFTEVDTVAWAEIDSVFVNTGTNALDVGEIALLKCGLELTTP
jgi:ActR/RegA family two-component response regulator